MPDLSKTYNDVRSYITTIIYNPVQRFLTDADYVQAIKWGAAQWAVMIGGIYTRQQVTTISDTEFYTVSDSIFKVRRAQYRKDPNTATEERSVIEVINPDDQAFIESVSIKDVNPVDQSALTITGSAQDVPKYLVYDPDTNQIRVLDKNKRANDIIELWVVSNALSLDPGVTWDGEAIDVPGIAFMACVALREKSRDIGEAEYFQGRAEKHASNVVRMRQKSRQVRQMQLGQTRSRRTRSMFGEK